MRPAAQLFYLAVFGLLGCSHGADDSRSVTKTRDASPNVCAVSQKAHQTQSPSRSAYRTFSQNEPTSIVSDACASYSTLEQLNERLHPIIQEISHDTDFFSHYRLNLYNKACPFWSDENGMCGNIACAVNTLENEEDIPLAWRADELGKLEGPKAQHPGRMQQKERPVQKPLQGQLGADVGESCVVEYDDECDERDYCIPEDETSTGKGDYVSLVDNPERFTGYGGPGAQQVWEAIYRENCFHKPPSEDSVHAPTGFGSPFGASNPLQGQAARQLRNVIKEHNMAQSVQQAIASGSSQPAMDELEYDEDCIEKRVFYRVISGMHASISAHLCWEWLNQTTGEWQPNLECYERRLHNHPERISNMYFNYALLLRAWGKVRNHLKTYSFCSADPEQDQHTKQLVIGLSDAINGQSERIFDESIMFKSPDAFGLKEDFRNRFRNVSRIMDCVGCDKCRLWGKVQTNGYGTALKILFEFDEKNPTTDPPLRRTELVALLNTLDRVSWSLEAVRHFEHTIDAMGLENAGQSNQKLRSSTVTGLGKIGNATTTEDDGLPDVQERRRKHANMTVEEIFWDEFDLVYRTFRFVLKQWMGFPGKV
jgi:ERO1-like protein beta